ncbi:hypothetical protein TNIN_57341 [Trichonephila inaurata madagascariensis]|uniref:Uncharacterized protein n=1 Tax=Trichonephila inaurata madagascariensis TaxID=2747483 RepID=A0A8X7BW65_9ARAC|nr:hypothetical protein TNIN_57341 [Trichonephila inaurata madagascariensis]
MVHDEIHDGPPISMLQTWQSRISQRYSLLVQIWDESSAKYGQALKTTPNLMSSLPNFLITPKKDFEVQFTLQKPFYFVPWVFIGVSILVHP